MFVPLSEISELPTTLALVNFARYDAVPLTDPDAVPVKTPALLIADNTVPELFCHSWRFADWEVKPLTIKPFCAAAVSVVVRVPNTSVETVLVLPMTVVFEPLPAAEVPIAISFEALLFPIDK